MASTDATNEVGFSTMGTTGRQVIKHGIATMATGTVNVNPGMSRIEAFVCTPVSFTTATEHVALTCGEDFPYTTQPNAITVKGVVIDEDNSQAIATTEQFAWIAIGEI